MEDVFELKSTPIHLGLGATAVPLEGFAWDPTYLDAYGKRFASDGDEGRLVTLGDMTDDWDSWERHPAGEEVVVCLSGRVRLIQEIDGKERAVEVGPGDAVVNPPGVWHTADILETAQALFITPGRGTDHKPR